MKSVKMSKIFVGVTSMALVAAISVGATLAYMTSRTDAKTNTFTVGNVAIVLHEDQWDNGDPITSRVAGNVAAQNFYPGLTVNKDPMVENTGKNACWTRLAITASDATWQAVADGKIQINSITPAFAATSSHWAYEGLANDAAGTVAGTTTKYYDYTITLNGATGAITDKTTTLFDTVTFDEDQNNGAVTTFSIDVVAQAIQSDGVDLATAWAKFAAQA